ncbi:MAG: YfhO family protein [Acidobacteriota bacterium]
MHISKMTKPQSGGKKMLPASRLCRIRRRARREHVAAFAAIFLFTAFLFAPLLRGKTFSMVAAHMYSQYPWAGVVTENPEIKGFGYPQTDSAETFYPNSVFATNAIRSGQLPMWLPYSFGGVPLLELGLTGWLYPPRLLAMLTMEPIRQHDFLLFTHLLMAGLGMYGLLREWRADFLGALLGAVVWELNGHNAFWLVLEHVALAAAWLPLMLLAATLAVRRQSFKWAIAAGAALGMALLTGSLHYVYLSALVLAGWYAALTAFSAIKRWRRGERRAALACMSLPVCSVIVALALGAACWLPMMQKLSSAHRKPHTFEQHLAEALPFSKVASALVSPQISGSGGKSADFASFAYTGIIAFVMALAAIIGALARWFRHSAPVVLGILLCLLSMGFVLGLSPYVSLLRMTIPYIGTFHLHTGFYLFCFSIGVLAAFGMTESGRLLARRNWSPYLRRCFFAAGCVMVIINAAQLRSFTRAITPVQPASSEWFFPETPLIQTLKNLQGSHRILPVAYRHPEGKWQPPVFAGKVAVDFDLRSGSGYESLLPLPTAMMWRTVEQGGAPGRDITPAYRPYFYHDRLPMALLEKISVGLLVTPPDTIPRDVDGGDAFNSGSLQLVYRGIDGCIYRLNRAQPRAFLVPQVLVAPDPSTSLETLVDEKFDARLAAIVIGEPAAAQTGLPIGEKQTAAIEIGAMIVSDRLNEVEVETETPYPAMMVLNDSWDPGWQAYVDGVQHPVFRVNYAFRGVVVPEGKHKVLFLYRPSAMLIGLSISAGALLLLILLYAKAGFSFVRRFYQGERGRSFQFFTR